VNSSRKHIVQFVVMLIILLLLNVISNYVYKRFDLTQDKRFTLSEAAKETISNVESPLLIDVFLKGNFPSEFTKLQSETRQLLDEFKAYNSNVVYNFINPLEQEDYQATIQDFGLTAAQVEVQENGKTTTEVLYPWALAYFKGKTVKIPLLKNQLGATSEERVNGSIQNLEYAFADGFSKLTSPKNKKVAVLKGNGELEDKFVADFFMTLKDYYFIAPFTLDSAQGKPQRTLEQLNTFDLVIIAKPTKPFNDSEKYILDQYTMQGGSTLWLIDASQNRIDSISAKTYALPMDLNLNDLLFKYGVRIKQNLIQDVYAAPIVLATGNENDSQYNKYPWFFSPLSASASNHPIVSNLEAVKFDYASAIDTLSNSIKKTILLSSSPISKHVGLPYEIDLDIEIPKGLKAVNEGPNLAEFNAGETPLAILLEGNFSSGFKNRVKPFDLTDDLNHTDEGALANMIVVSDGDLIKNQFDRGRPLELGFDKMTQARYGNKEFLLNAVNYLLDDRGLINIRTKEITVPFLDAQKTADERSKWQAINLLLPLGLLLIFGFIFAYLRRKAYAKVSS
jgi:ABC-2 type transport system permease protein